MPQSFPQGIRVGGSALPDGVMMLTPLAVAFARENQDGNFSVESFPLPERKPHPLEKLPFVRILPKLVAQMSLVVRGWKARGGKRLPLPMLGAIVAIGLLSNLINVVCAGLPAGWHAAGSSLLQLFLFFALIGVTRAVPQFGRIWRFHGGEHQAISAYEAGMALTPENAATRTLYHPRCGTNLATLAIVFMVPGMVAGSLISGVAGYLLTVAAPIPALCIAFEIIMLGQKKVKPVLWPGLAFQRLTVATPGPAESLAGVTALRAVLAEHARIQALRESTRAVVPSAGAALAQPAR
jgi:uncharacterized protein YqhQ